MVINTVTDKNTFLKAQKCTQLANCRNSQASGPHKLGHGPIIKRKPKHKTWNFSKKLLSYKKDLETPKL